MRRLALVPILAAGLLFPPLAAALGLGEIEVHSALNQRLDARIPLRGVPEGRVDDVIVALASERAFRDVGLRRPHTLTRLQFEIRRRDDGGYYVHATSSEPIAEPFLSFLVEVDGPGGNLLREYTVLLDPPVFATEGAERARDSGERDPEAEAPGAEPGDAAAPRAEPPAETEADAPSAAETATATAPEGAARAESTWRPDAGPTGPAEDAAEPAVQSEDAAAAPEEDTDETTAFGDTPVFLQVEREQARAERARERAESAERQRRAEEEAEEEQARAEAYQPGAADADGQGPDAAGDERDAGGPPAEYGPVERGDTLWSIASRLRRGDMTVQQLMLALLRYNPEAFADGNINRLKQGYVLRVPEGAEIRSVSAQQAIAQVREQNSLWREWRTAARGEDDDTVVAEREPDTDTDAVATDEAEADTATPPEGDDDSRLSIVGAEEGGASSDQSAAATTEAGSTAEEELRLAQEQLESARMEKAELEGRVADLEETVDKMERLITLREDQLAQLQEQLRELQRDEAERAAEDDAGDADPGAAATAGAGEPGDDDAAGAGGGTGGDDSPATDGTPEEAGGAGSDSATTSAGGDGGGAPEQAAEATGADGDGAATRTGTGGWLDSVTGVASGITAAVTGTLAGLAGGAAPFAGATSPGVLGAVALLLAALAGLLALRRRRAAAAADAEVAAAEDAAPVDDADAADEVDLSRMDAGSDLVAEELDSDAPARPERAATESAGELDEAFDLGDLEADTGAPAAGTAEEEEAPKDDTVAEAEVYLAYGLHQQAEDLLRLALRESPGRADYHEKLLETLYAAGKAGEFVTEAGTFHGMVESTDSRMWQRVVAMGREIAPEHDLFRQGGAPDVRPEELQKTRPATADIELDAGGAEAGDEEDDFARSLMLDEGEGGTAGEAAAGAPAEEEAMGGEDLEFDLGDFEQLTGADEETATAGDAGRSGEAAAADADEALDFDLADLGTAGAGTGGGGGEPGADAGDLDLDFGLEDTTGADETPARAGADEQAGAADTGGVPDLDLGDLEFEPGPATGASGGGAGGDSGDDTLDVGDLAAAPAADSATGGAAGADDEDDEFDTMLDLARAYIDMGDPESASNALEEVIEAGSERQRNDARSLLETVK